MNLFAVIVSLFKDAKTTYSKNGRNSALMRRAKNRAKKRDGYKCAVTGKKGVMLHVHHLNSWSKYPEQRFEVRNLITLDRKIHKQFHAHMGGTNVPCTRADFEDWLKVRKDGGRGQLVLNCCLVMVLIVAGYTFYNY